MRYTDDAALDDDWELLQVERNGKRPCEGAFEDDANDEELVNIFSQLRALIAAGCPPDTEKGTPILEHVGKHRRGRSSISVWVLKAKPSRWRLYFIVDSREKKQALFLHAVSKKTDKRDPQDFQRCCTVLDGLADGRYERVPFEVPDP